jgi:GTP pyrophosphokinase
MPLRTELDNGDQVEIITSQAQIPSPIWENFVVTGKARAHIKRFIRSREKEEYISLGQAILEGAFANEGYEYTETIAHDILTVFNKSTIDDLCADVGAGHITGLSVVEAVFPGIKEENKSRLLSFARMRSRRKKSKVNDKIRPAIAIKGMIPGMALHYAGCCHALPGDRIVGIVTKGRGMTIHTIDCEKLEDFIDTPEHWIDLSWNEEELDGFHVGHITLVVGNTLGSLGKLCTIIGNNSGNISNLKITNRTPEFFDMSIDIEVRDAKHLTVIIAALRAILEIKQVERGRS